MMARFLLLLSMALFLAACALPALTFHKAAAAATAGPALSAGGETLLGYQVFLFGWAGLAVGQLAWFANLFWLAGMCCSMPRRVRTPAVLHGSLALILALTAFGVAGSDAPAAADGGLLLRQQFGQLRAGAYLWILAIAVQFVAAVILMILCRRRDKLQPSDGAAATVATAEEATTSESESSRSTSTSR